MRQQGGWHCAPSNGWGATHESFLFNYLSHAISAATDTQRRHQFSSPASLAISHWFWGVQLAGSADWLPMFGSPALTRFLERCIFWSCYANPTRFTSGFHFCCHWVSNRMVMTSVHDYWLDCFIVTWFGKHQCRKHSKFNIKYNKFSRKLSKLERQGLRCSHWQSKRFFRPEFAMCFTWLQAGLWSPLSNAIVCVDDI